MTQKTLPPNTVVLEINQTRPIGTPERPAFTGQDIQRLEVVVDPSSKTPSEAADAIIADLTPLYTGNVLTSYQEAALDQQGIPLVLSVPDKTLLDRVDLIRLETRLDVEESRVMINGQYRPW